MMFYEKTPAVDEDWEEIANYTLNNYGEKQLLKYTSNLTKCLEDMAKGKSSYKDIKVQRNLVRVKHCQKHYIFALIRKDKPMLIIAIFHERMDLMQRVKKRLR